MPLKVGASLGSSLPTYETSFHDFHPYILPTQMQAQLLWPDVPLEVVVSLGSGLPTTKPRERGLHAYLDTGNLLIESATSTERVHEAAATLLALVPGVRYFRCAAGCAAGIRYVAGARRG